MVNVNVDNGLITVKKCIDRDFHIDHYTPTKRASSDHIIRAFLIFLLHKAAFMQKSIQQMFRLADMANTSDYLEIRKRWRHGE